MHTPFNNYGGSLVCEE